MKYETREILSDLKAKYKEQLNPDLTSVKVGQSKTEIILIVQDGSNEIFIDNLDFIADDELIEFVDILPLDFFTLAYSLDENADKFVKELDDTTLYNCFDRLILHL